MSEQQSKRYGTTMFVLMWVALLALFVVVFGRWFDRAENPNQRVSTQVSKGGALEVVLERNHYGHYVVSGKINQQPVQFMIDTGASDVSVPAHIARQIGLHKGAEVTFSTANGYATGYLTRLAEVRVGEIVLRDIRASINPNVDHDEVLLGMSFLKRLEFSQRGETLTLRQHPDS
jgi:aspartyl protease family protein